MRSSLQKTNKFFLVNACKKPHTKLSYSPKFHPLKYRFSLRNSSSKEPKIQHYCHQFERHSATRPHFCGNIPSKGFCPRLPTTTTLAYGCSLAILFQAKYAQNLANDGSEDREVDKSVGKKLHFADLMKEGKSSADFCASHQFQVGRNNITYTQLGC